MNIKLVSGPNKNPIDIIVGSARTCYSKTLKTPEEISSWDKKKELAVDLFKSGHHTTLQHINFTFSLEGISRLIIWRFFHAHKHYNSDQVSQRYAAIDTKNFYLPKKRVEEANVLHSELINNYNSLIDIFEDIYKGSNNPVEVNIARKKAMENARYILPQSIFANLYHTINLSTLLRYFAISTASNIEGSQELFEIINKMVLEVVMIYPDLMVLFNSVKKQKHILKVNESIFNFSEDMELLNISSNIPKFTGDFGYYSDPSAAYNLFALEESIGVFTFGLNLSLSADAQNQRHRTSIGIRPELRNELKRIYSFKDFLSKQYIPNVFHKSSEALNLFNKSMELIYNELLLSELEYSYYLLPNSFKIPIVETTSFADFAHKAKMRLCLNAQEEIRESTEKMVYKLKDAGVDTSMFVPPCVSRYMSDITPTCSEGARFCGIKEWKKDKYKI